MTDVLKTALIHGAIQVPFHMDMHKMVSEKTREVVMSQARTADRIVISQEMIEDGLDGIAYQISSLASSIENGFEILGEKMGEVIWNLERNRGELVKIVDLLQRPLDVQSKELRQRAEESYKNGWIDEAISDFDHALQKNKTDFTIHMSLGILYLYHKNDADAAAKALHHFRHAAKYSAPRSIRHCALSKYFACVTLSAIGNYNDARDEALEGKDMLAGTKVDSFFLELRYQIARNSAKLGDAKTALKHLKKLVNRDRYYYTKASADDYFKTIKEDLDTFLKEELARLLQQANHDVKMIESALDKIRSIDSSFKNPTEYDLALAKTHVSRKSIIDLLDSLILLSKVKNNLSSLINKRMNEIRKTVDYINKLPKRIEQNNSRLNRLEGDMHRDLKHKHDKTVVRGLKFIPLLVLGLVLMVVFVESWSKDGNLSGVFFAIWILSITIIGMVYWLEKRDPVLNELRFSLITTKKIIKDLTYDTELLRQELSKQQKPPMISEYEKWWDVLTFMSKDDSTLTQSRLEQSEALDVLTFMSKTDSTPSGTMPKGWNS